MVEPLGIELSEKRPLRLLLSYHYFRRLDVAGELAAHFGGVPLDMIADSGAFSAYTLGRAITVEEYAEWLWKWKDVFHIAAALDVIGDAKASLAQSIELRRIAPPSTTIVPVFHSTDGGWDWLTAYLDEGFDYIGISPIGALYRAPVLLDQWLSECFARKPAHVRYHGFGVTGSRTLRFPWYTADSSSHMAVFRFGNLMLWDGAQLRAFDPAKPAHMLQNRAMMRAHGLRPTDYVDLRHAVDRQKHVVPLLSAAMRAMRACEVDLSQRGGVRAVFHAVSIAGDGKMQAMGEAVRSWRSLDGER